MKCPYCKVEMVEIHGEFGPEKIDFQGAHCPKCGEEFLTMEQLKELGEKHKTWRESQKSIFSKWGNSIGIRIPSELVAALKIKPGATAYVKREKNAIKIVPA